MTPEVCARCGHYRYQHVQGGFCEHRTDDWDCACGTYQEAA